LVLGDADVAVFQQCHIDVKPLPVEGLGLGRAILRSDEKEKEKKEGNKELP
jgi:hypothetical protein